MHYGDTTHPANRYISCDNYPDDKMEDYQNCSTSYNCVQSEMCSHKQFLQVNRDPLVYVFLSYGQSVLGLVLRVFSLGGCPERLVFKMT